MRVPSHLACVHAPGPGKFPAKAPTRSTFTTPTTRRVNNGQSTTTASFRLGPAAGADVSRRCDHLLEKVRGRLRPRVAQRVLVLLPVRCRSRERPRPTRAVARWHANFTCPHGPISYRSRTPTARCEPVGLDAAVELGAHHRANLHHHHARVARDTRPQQVRRTVKAASLLPRQEGPCRQA